MSDELSRLERLVAAAMLVAIAGCSSGSGGPPIIDGPTTFLTTDNLGGEDDDPTIAVDASGTVHVVWFSDRDGTKDLYEVHSTAFDLDAATITWSPPIRITDNDAASFPPPSQGDNFPALVVDADGTHHLAWHRVNLINASHILYAQSDGTTAGWAAATVTNVTSGLNFDRFPSFVRVADDDFRIYFNSSTQGAAGKNGIFMAKSIDGGATWGAPSAIASLNVVGEQSAFPTIVLPSPEHFRCAFVRWKLEPSNDALDPTSDVFYATSTEGLGWIVTPVTFDDVDLENDFTPSFFVDHGGGTQLAWASIGFGDPAADIVRMRVDDIALYPDAVATMTPAFGVADHSPHVAAIKVGNRRLYLMVWVRIVAPPHNQVVYRLFSEL